VELEKFSKLDRKFFYDDWGRNFQMTFHPIYGVTIGSLGRDGKVGGIGENGEALLIINGTGPGVRTNEVPYGRATFNRRTGLEKASKAIESSKK
jgi:hypothetical protein